MDAASIIAALAQQHAATPGVTFVPGPGGLVFVEVDNRHARARLCLQGAQLTHWQPHDQAHPVLWLSAAARYIPGKAIRGGIPVCWPWFGAATAGAAAPTPTGPAHGFVRTQAWQFDGAQALADGATRLSLSVADNAETRALWPAAFALELRVTVGRALDLELVSRNTGAVSLRISEALHTYFRVGDIGAVTVHGLAGAGYFDAAAAAAGEPAPHERPAGSPASDPIGFAGEVDRVYDHRGPCRIDDPRLGRRIHVATSGSASTVVWNPWDAKAVRLGDLGEHGWREMVCVESGNARAHGVHLAPGASHGLAVRYHVDA